MATDPATLARLCQLARLKLTPAEAEVQAGELGRVLDLLAALKQAPVDGLEPLSHPLDLTLGLRDDAVTEFDQHAALLALSAETQGGYYLVPKVIE